MGKGKGNPEYWVAKVKPGRIMFEIDGVSWELAQEALCLAAAKLPLIPVLFVALATLTKEFVIMGTVKAEELRAKTSDELKTRLVGLKRSSSICVFRQLMGRMKTRHVHVSCAAKSPASRLFSARRLGQQMP